MIRVTRAKKALRARDKKRNRLLLCIGERKYHITREEAASLQKQLRRFKLSGQREG